ncbi:exonuclease V, chloroplastic-like [Primulina tabacum]|uniref:exonuclease V, chloroplastic-like n=1 Tax=Primulina tabacum TaxID=48773 RepID=UPI003F5AA7F2
MTPSPTRPPSTAKFPVEIITRRGDVSHRSCFLLRLRRPSVRFSSTRMSGRLDLLLCCLSVGSPVCTESVNSDIEDSGRIIGSYSPNRKRRVLESFLHRFRRRRGLSVTDITSTEWCEKQMEFFLLLGRPKSTEAMKAGSARHMELEEEVSQRVKIDVESIEDRWAVKFMNFIWGINQLLLDGLTRELPVVGFAEGVWMVGIIDEIRMSLVESERIPILVDTKTSLQLMCYKYLWDSLVANKFPSHKFFDYFSLNPHYILSPEVRQVTEKSGFPSEVKKFVR